MFQKIEALLRELLEIGNIACEFAELEARLEGLHCGNRHHGHTPRLAFEINTGEFKVRGANMIFTMPPLNAAGLPSTVATIGSPVLADGVTPSRATLSAPVYTSSDTSVFTIAPDPNVVNGAIITAVANPAPGTTASATWTETATATEPDGTTTEVVTGVATLVLSAASVTPPPAAALVFTMGIPQ